MGEEGNLIGNMFEVLAQLLALIDYSAVYEAIEGVIRTLAIVIVPTLFLMAIIASQTDNWIKTVTSKPEWKQFVARVALCSLGLAIYFTLLPAMLTLIANVQTSTGGWGNYGRMLVLINEAVYDSIAATKEAQTGWRALLSNLTVGWILYIFFFVSYFAAFVAVAALSIIIRITQTLMLALYSVWGIIAISFAVWEKTNFIYPWLMGMLHIGVWILLEAITIYFSFILVANTINQALADVNLTGVSLAFGTVVLIIYFFIIKKIPDIAKSLIESAVPGAASSGLGRPAALIGALAGFAAKKAITGGGAMGGRGALGAGIAAAGRLPRIGEKIQNSRLANTIGQSPLSYITGGTKGVARAMQDRDILRQAGKYSGGGKNTQKQRQNMFANMYDGLDRVAQGKEHNFANEQMNILNSKGVKLEKIKSGEMSVKEARDRINAKKDNVQKEKD